MISEFQQQSMIRKLEDKWILLIYNLSNERSKPIVVISIKCHNERIGTNGSGRLDVKNNKS